jgi:hypothetical protein
MRTAAARHALVLDDLAIKVVLRLDNAAKEHPAVHAGTGALEAGVVRLYSVVILGRWVRGCARLCGVHSSVPTFLRAVSVELKAREQREITERLEALEEDLGHKGGSNRWGA